MVQRLKRLYSPAAIPSWIIILWKITEALDTMSSIVDWISPVWKFLSSPTGTIVLLAIGFGILIYLVVKPEKKVNHTPTITKIDQFSQTNPDDSVKLDGFEFYPQRPSLSWFKAELAKCKEVWALWNTGGTARNNRVIEDIGTIKRLILMSPEKDNPALQQLADAMGEKTKFLVTTITEVAKAGREQRVEIVYWKGLTANLMVIGFPISGDDSWILLDIVYPYLSADQRPVIRIWKSRNPELYGRLHTLYSRIWHESSRTVKNR